MYLLLKENKTLCEKYLDIGDFSFDDDFNLLIL